MSGFHSSPNYLSAFPKGYNPNNPPPFNVTVQYVPELTQLYGYLAGSLVQEIENRRAENIPRTFMFNKMAYNGYMNDDFRDLLMQAIRICLVKRFCRNESDWYVIVDSAAKETINVVLAAMVLTNMTLRSMYQPEPHLMSSFQNAFSLLETNEREAEFVIQSINAQNMHNQHNPTMMGMHNPNTTPMTPMTHGYNPTGAGMMNSPYQAMNEPIVETPEFGRIPLSMYNRLVAEREQLRRQQMYSPQPHQAMHSHSQGGMMNHQPQQNNRNPLLSENVQRQLVRAPNMGMGSNVINSSVPSDMISQWGVVGHEVDEHEISPQSSNIQRVEPVTNNLRQENTMTTQATTITSVRNGVEYFGEKPVFRSTEDPDHFYCEFDGTLVVLFTPEYPGIPANNPGKNKRIYKINNVTGKAVVTLIDLTEQEKMDIARHRILMNEEEAQRRLNALKMAVASPMVHLDDCIKEREVESASSDEVSITEEVIELPDYTHVVKEDLSTIEDTSRFHETQRIQIASEVDEPSAFTTVSNQVTILPELTFEGVGGEVINRLRNARSFKAVSDVFSSVRSSTDSEDDDIAVDAYKRLIDKLEAMFVKAVNERLQIQIGIDVTVTDWHTAYTPLLKGLEEHYGAFTAEIFLRDEASFIKGVFNEVTEEIILSVKSLLNDKVEMDGVVIIPELSSITTIKAKMNDLDLDFDSSNSVMINRKTHPVLHDLTSTILDYRTGNGEKVLRNIIRTQDNMEFSIHKGLWNSSTVFLKKL
ncbi:MAG: hypothetical protein M0R77_00415 [Gammaproteobacteria bacterium]|nr:hypothetical protein [Acholeplasmataceae bacterium]MCK9529017.1 hypothetical protein [Gammaproteobacteria bacterium]